MDDKPWVRIQLAKPQRLESGKGERLPDWLKPIRSDEDPRPDSPGPNPRAVAKAARYLGRACSITRCSIANVGEHQINTPDKWKTWMEEVTVSFSSNADLDKFIKEPHSQRWKFAETHRRPAEYGVTVIEEERPTPAALERLMLNHFGSRLLA